ncbi:MAG: sigma-54-dependent Fis family transcriptional regulator [Planctomycetota bacterium]|nr:sigma-54-dependent Fis family transcriptional regulator [Planctomycetota bacterium]
MAQILVVDDERSLLEMIEILLTRSGHQVMTAASADAALTAFREQSPELVLLDLRLGGESGLDVLRAMKAHDPLVPVIVITAYSTWDNAVQAMRLGAYDFIKKPFEDNDQVREVVSRALAQRATLSRAERREAAAEILAILAGDPCDAPDARRVAPTDLTVLDHGRERHRQGAPGARRALHVAAPAGRSAGELPHFRRRPRERALSATCGGAFLGRLRDEEGPGRGVRPGDLLPDEIGELSPSTQVKPCASSRTGASCPSAARGAARSTCGSSAATKLGRTRAGGRAEWPVPRGLHLPINVLPIRSAGCATARSDCPAAAAHFLARYRASRASIGADRPRPSSGSRRTDWPGNVRELENTVQRAV